LDAAESNRMVADTVSAEAASRAGSHGRFVLPSCVPTTADSQPDYHAACLEIQKLAIAKKSHTSSLMANQRLRQRHLGNDRAFASARRAQGQLH
jgi:hypothetical protein